jgi:hypothetical protein
MAGLRVHGADTSGWLWFDERMIDVGEKVFAGLTMINAVKMVG